MGLFVIWTVWVLLGAIGYVVWRQKGYRPSWIGSPLGGAFTLMAAISAARVSITAKTCPYCRFAIPLDAVVCGYCRSVYHAMPAAVADITPDRARSKRQADMERFQKSMSG